MSFTETDLVPTTELSAVNTLLRAVGIADVITLDAADQDDDAAYALKVLSDTSREVQSRGWHFNEEVDYPIDPSPSGEIVVPYNCTGAVLAPRSRAWNLTLRGQRFYDVQHRTYAIRRTTYVNMVLLLPFTDIPQPIRWYIVALAGRIFGTDKAPDMNTYRFTSKVEADAMVAALNYDQDSRDTTLRESSEHFVKSGSRR